MVDLQKLPIAYCQASITEREKGSYFEEVVTDFRTNARYPLSSWEEVGASIEPCWIIGLQPGSRKNKIMVNDDAAFHQPASCDATYRGL